MVNQLPISKISATRPFLIGSPSSIRPNDYRSRNGASIFETPGRLQQFSELHRVCSASLEQLQTESRKTLNLLALLTHFPITVEARDELQLQFESEERALSAYQDNLRELIALVKP
jgi:hypothetical protein